MFNMSMMIEPFNDRVEAGHKLAAALDDYYDSDCLVLAIPRGGVVIGYIVAQKLECVLDVIVPRKIGAPGQPELAIGAVASWGDHEVLLDHNAIRYLGVSDDYINKTVERELDEVNRRLLAYRGTTSPPDVSGKSVVLIDDGVATGYTVRAAALAIRKLNAAEIILAVPVAAPESLIELRPNFDDIICLKAPSPFLAVGYWYRNFNQVSDEEVISLLQSAQMHKR